MNPDILNTFIATFAGWKFCPPNKEETYSLEEKAAATMCWVRTSSNCNPNN